MSYHQPVVWGIPIFWLEYFPTKELGKEITHLTDELSSLSLNGKIAPEVTYKLDALVKVRSMMKFKSFSLEEEALLQKIPRGRILFVVMGSKCHITRKCTKQGEADLRLGFFYLLFELQNKVQMGQNVANLRITLLW